MARTARSMIREAKTGKNGMGENYLIVAENGFRPKKTNSNPLSDLIDDETYEVLKSHGLFYKKAVRNYGIRKNYREMRKKMAGTDAIKQLHESFPYLEYDTIRKIIYTR